jgi:hypothetical protein
MTIDWDKVNELRARNLEQEAGWMRARRMAQQVEEEAEAIQETIDKAMQLNKADDHEDGEDGPMLKLLDEIDDGVLEILKLVVKDAGTKKEGRVEDAFRAEDVHECIGRMVSDKRVTNFNKFPLQMVFIVQGWCREKLGKDIRHTGYDEVMEAYGDGKK